MENLNQERIQAINGVLNQLNEALNMHVVALAGYDNVLLGQGHVVMLNGFAVGFDVIPQGNGFNLYQNPRPVGLIGVGIQFFDQDAAEQLAANVRDGNGNPAQAVHIRQAHQNRINDLNVQIANLNALLN